MLKNLKKTKVFLIGFPLKDLCLLIGVFQLVCSEFAEFIDLGHGVDNTTVYWEDEQSFVSNVSEHSEPYYYAWGEFSSPEHGGTHIDAPYHFWKDGWKLGQIPLKHLIQPGILVDVSTKVAGNRDYLLTSNDLSDWEKEHGEVNQNKKYIMLIKFGWSDKYVNRTDYFGIGLNNSNPKERNFPGISESGADWIASKGNIVGVGVDTPSVDSGRGGMDAVAHKILAKKNIYNLENVALSGKELPSKEFYLIIMPIKLTHGTGGPVRIIVSPESLSHGIS